MSTMDLMMVLGVAYLIVFAGWLAWDNRRDERRHVEQMARLLDDLEAARGKPQRGLITDSEARP